MKNLTWQNPEQLFVAQELINKVKSKCCGIKVPIKIYGSRLQYYALLETQIDSICEHDSDGDHIYGTFQIDFTSWNGEELFYLKDSGAIVCSLRVKELIERHNISNVSFEGLDKY